MFWINLFKSINIPCVQHLPDHVSTFPNPNEGKSIQELLKRNAENGSTLSGSTFLKLTTQAMATATDTVNSKWCSWRSCWHLRGKKAMCFSWHRFLLAKTLDVKNLFPNVASQQYISKLQLNWASHHLKFSR